MRCIFLCHRVAVTYNFITQAKLLIEETIRRNQSPVPREEMLVSFCNLDIISPTN